VALRGAVDPCRSAAARELKAWPTVLNEMVTARLWISMGFVIAHYVQRY
jgi:hypothetical protein